MLAFEANGLKFAALEWGSGDGPLALLFHGFPDTAETWNDIAPELARAGFRVVAPYLRGYAPTALPPRDPDSRTLGEDVVGAMRALGGGQKVHLVGHDWGAEAVYAAAHLAPELVEKLVTVGIPHRETLPMTPQLAWKARHFGSLRLPGAARRLTADNCALAATYWKRWSPTWSFALSELDPVRQAFAVPGSAQAAIGYYRAASLITPKFMKPKLTVPTLLIGGGDDPAVTPADFERGKRHVAARVELAMIPGGHFCHRESPRAFLDAVVPFLK